MMVELVAAGNLMNAIIAIWAEKEMSQEHNKQHLHKFIAFLIPI